MSCGDLEHPVLVVGADPHGFDSSRDADRDGCEIYGIVNPATAVVGIAPTTTQVTIAAPAPAPVATTAGCDANYTPCIPPFANGDLNCENLGFPVTVTGADPHGLDRDGDGVGCETDDAAPATTSPVQTTVTTTTSTTGVAVTAAQAGFVTTSTTATTAPASASSTTGAAGASVAQPVTVSGENFGFTDGIPTMAGATPAVSASTMASASQSASLAVTGSQDGIPVGIGMVALGAGLLIWSFAWRAQRESQHSWS